MKTTGREKAIFKELLRIVQKLWTWMSGGWIYVKLVLGMLTAFKTKTCKIVVLKNYQNCCQICSFQINKVFLTKFRKLTTLHLNAGKNTNSKTF